MFQTRLSGTAACRQINRRHISIASHLKVFADAKSADFLAAAASPSSIPRLHNLPEVIVTGRANVGKSSLLNAVIGRNNLLHTSKQPGRTQTLNFYRVGPPPGSLVIVDAPGYGARGRPEWGELFDNYVQDRKELKRIYILFNAKHGLNDVDRAMLRSLNEQCQSSLAGGRQLTLQAIITKIDALSSPSVKGIQSMQRDIFETAPLCLPAIITSVLKYPYFGVEDVRRSMVEACGIGRTKIGG